MRWLKTAMKTPDPSHIGHIITVTTPQRTAKKPKQTGFIVAEPNAEKAIAMVEKLSHTGDEVTDLGAISVPKVAEATSAPGKVRKL